MASKEEILGILAGESGLMNRAVLSKRLNLPTSSFQSQLDRMEKQGLVEKNEQNEYTITEDGRTYFLVEPLKNEALPGKLATIDIAEKVEGGGRKLVLTITLPEPISSR